MDLNEFGAYFVCVVIIVGTIFLIYTMYRNKIELNKENENILKRCESECMLKGGFLIDYDAEMEYCTCYNTERETEFKINLREEN